MRVFDALRVFILRLDNTVESIKIPPVVLSDQSTLDDIRHVFVSGPLGTTDHDIFFPTWTRSIHVVKDTGDIGDHTLLNHEKVNAMKYDITTTEQLQEMLDEEHTSPGSFIIILQQCRSRRYSRKPTPVDHHQVTSTASSSTSATSNSTSTTTTTTATTTAAAAAVGLTNKSNFNSACTGGGTEKVNISSNKNNSNNNNNNNTATAAFSLSMKANHHHHLHNHHHHYQSHTQSHLHSNPSSVVPGGVSNSTARATFAHSFSHLNNQPPHHHAQLVKPFVQKRHQNNNSYRHIDENNTFTFPPPPLHQFISSQGVPPQQSTFESGSTTEQTFLFYPDPLLQYGMIPAPPATSAPPPPHLFPHVYAVPWNVGCFNYIPAGAIPPTWFIA